MNMEEPRSPTSPNPASASRELSGDLLDFGDLRRSEMCYVDETMFLPLLEDAHRHLVFTRPRRFGKSLLLKALEGAKGQPRAYLQARTCLCERSWQWRCLQRSTSSSRGRWWSHQRGIEPTPMVQSDTGGLGWT